MGEPVRSASRYSAVDRSGRSADRSGRSVNRSGRGGRSFGYQAPKQDRYEAPKRSYQPESSRALQRRPEPERSYQAPERSYQAPRQPERSYQAPPPRQRQLSQDSGFSSDGPPAQQSYQRQPPRQDYQRQEPPRDFQVPPRQARAPQQQDRYNPSPNGNGYQAPQKQQPAQHYAPSKQQN